MTRWQARAVSVRGASHERRNIPNQDAASSFVADGGAVAVACVADGHGSERSFRSAIGARLAVEVGIEALRDTLRVRGSDPDGLEAVRDDLPASIVARWTAAVRDHADRHPFDEGERRLLEVPGADEVLLSYGSTFVAAAVTSSALLLLQLGDGDILVVTGDGRVSRPLGLPPEPQGVETSSLSIARRAPDDFVIEIRPAAWRGGELVLLATDGYANSFAEDRGFLAVGSDIQGLISRRGLAWVGAQLPRWLARASVEGSGDDITVALLSARPTRT